MTVTLESVHKAAVINYVVEGDEADVEAAGQTKKTVKNTGSADLYFPEDFTGEVAVTVQGSKPDSAPDTGSITIS